jgi:hypothetical protein
MKDRLGIDEITSDQLDALYAQLARVHAVRDRIADSVGADAIYCLDLLDEALGISAPAATEATEPATSPLREQIAEALLDHLSRTADIRRSEDGELAFMPVVTEDERMRITDAVDKVVAPVLARFKETNSGLARALLAPATTEAETTARVFAGLHRSAEQDVTRVIELYERWVKEGAPPLGTPVARWWDKRLVELHDAIVPPTDQPKGT